jgi:hypothetical protein
MCIEAGLNILCVYTGAVTILNKVHGCIYIHTKFFSIIFRIGVYMSIIISREDDTPIHITIGRSGCVYK